MILVIEPTDDKPPRFVTRVVLEADEKDPFLLDIRLALRCAIDHLPGRIDLVPTKRFQDKRKK